MAGDLVACEYFQPARRGRSEADRCRHPRAADFGRARATACLGLPGLCFDRGLREQALRDLWRLERASERPASVWIRLARRAGW